MSSFVAQQEHIRARLEQTNALKDEFVGIVSHELRTPMTVVRGFIEFQSREIRFFKSSAEKHSRKNSSEYFRSFASRQ